MESRKVAFYTLGCKLNFSETSTISRYFIERGFQIVPFNAYADFYVINTCSVTSTANKKGRNAVAKTSSLNPNAIVIVTGCYAQLKIDEVKSITGVDYVFGANNKSDIDRILDTASKQQNAIVGTTDHNEMKEFFPAYSMGDRTRAFLKVQDGCDYFCAYCTVPFARGRSRNQSISQCIEQARILASHGMKEVVITGVNIGDFGKSTGENFGQLLRELVKIDEIKRWRIGSIEPNLLTDEIIEFIATNDKIMPHFHIPLQSGCDEILKLVGRRYDTALFRHKIEYIKKLIPNAFIGIDLIVGLNGEEDAHFAKTVEFVKSLDISFIHHFQYSERENTRALLFKPRTLPQTKKQRSDIVTGISDEKHSAFLSAQLGKTGKVLFESKKKNGKMFGFTDNYIKVAVDYDASLINQICRVELLDILDSETVNAKIIK